MYLTVFVAGKRFPGCGWEAYPAGVRFPVKRAVVNLMKKNLRGKIREYIESEDGKVGVKSPLSLGVAAGGLLLAHVIGTSEAEPGWCYTEGATCGVYGSATYICGGPWISIDGTWTGTCIPQ